MPDITHELTINAPPERVFQAISTPEGLNQWWTKESSGTPVSGAEYKLFFGPEYDWRARATRCIPPSCFELQITQAHPDWQGTRVGFGLRPEGSDSTRLIFSHSGWPEANEHWRVSCYCWAMYLRVMRRYLEHAEQVPYERRLDV